MYEELDKIKNECLNCTGCELSKSRTNVVFSDGIPNSKLMLIGEAPGYWEDQKGKPFVGKAGQLLDKIFASIELDRSKIYICNTIKCRPPENRNPLPEEKAACREFLDAQLEILKPKIILICGSIALNSLLPNERSITLSLRMRCSPTSTPIILPMLFRSLVKKNRLRGNGS